METLDAIVLAGDTSHSVRVGGGNKCMLEVGGRPLVDFVLEALDESRTVGDVYVVGPKAKLDAVIGGKPRLKRFVSLEQQEDIVANIVCGYEAKMSSGSGSNYVLILSGDMALITGWELDRFATHSNYRDYNCVMAFAAEKSLKPFYPYGIRLNYLFFKQFVGRINNMFIADLKAVTNLHYVGEVYRLRYQKHFYNYLRYVWTVLLSDLNKTGLICAALLPQLCLQLDRMGFERLARWLAGFNDRRAFERYGGEVFHIRLALHCMDTAFGALDVDSDEELNIYRAHFDEFQDIVRRAIAEQEIHDTG